MDKMAIPSQAILPVQVNFGGGRRSDRIVKRFNFGPPDPKFKPVSSTSSQIIVVKLTSQVLSQGLYQPSFGTNHKIYYLHDSSTLYMYVIFLYKCWRLKSPFLGHLHGHAVIQTLLCLLCLTAKVDQGWNPKKDSNIMATLPLYLNCLLIVQFYKNCQDYDLILNMQYRMMYVTPKLT